MIEIKNLTKRYGDKIAVDDVSFTVNKGEILGFLGPNGAGKSTTMNILTGYLSATEGNCVIDGFDILDNPIEAKKKIGYLPEQPPLYMDMTVDEYLDFMYDLKRVKVGASKKEHIAAICELVKIADVRRRIIKNLSKGYKQRVGIAQALLGNPEVLILDEPTVGLDPKQIIEIRSLIKNLSESHTVILSSHILPEIQAVCDRVIVISKGKLVADDTESNLSNRLSDDKRYSVRIEGHEADVLGILESIPEMKEVKSLGEKEPGITEYIIEANDDAEDIRREVFKRMASRNFPIMGLKSSELTLEDIFLQLTMDNSFDEENINPEHKEKRANLDGIPEQLGDYDSDLSNLEEGREAEFLSTDTPDAEFDTGTDLTDEEVLAEADAEAASDKTSDKKDGGAQ